jgi:hypothetical protein
MASAQGIEPLDAHLPTRGATVLDAIKRHRHPAFSAISGCVTPGFSHRGFELLTADILYAVDAGGLEAHAKHWGAAATAAAAIHCAA